MVVQIKQTEHLERVITFNTEHIKFEDLKDYIKTYDINLEEITPHSYFDIEYTLDFDRVTDTVYYYDCNDPNTKQLQDYVINKIKTAYGDEG